MPFVRGVTKTGIVLFAVIATLFGAQAKLPAAPQQRAAIETQHPLSHARPHMTVPGTVASILKDSSRPTLSGRDRSLLGESHEPAAGKSHYSRANAGALGGAAGGAVCFQGGDNCHPPDQSNALTSNRLLYVVADDFRPAVSQSISEVCWWGAYARRTPTGFENCQGESQDSFEVRYFADNGGVPGALLSTFSQTLGTLIVLGPEATGEIIAGEVPEYEYSATHSPFPLTQGGCYWIEISNDVGESCLWVWEVTGTGDAWALQDDLDAPAPDGYELSDSISEDLAFCLDVPLADAEPCVPNRPAHDQCAEALPIAGTGTFDFDNQVTTTDGVQPNDCYPGQAQIDSDLWYCWTAPCSESVLVSTCGLTGIDTSIAVYDGCGLCPPTNADMLACDDDRCGEDIAPSQSMVVFEAEAGQSYLIRVGSYPGEPRGTGQFSISCGPPPNEACPGSGNCCLALDCDVDVCTPGCDDATCCGVVCACDPFCCQIAWDEGCATTGFLGSGCGAELLCNGRCANDCCIPSMSPGCSNAECQEAVCACDSFCCDVSWDQGCAEYGYNNNGCGALELCGDLCVLPGCPVGSITFEDPPDEVVDARQPHDPSDTASRLGIDAVTVSGPPGMENLSCWTLCETRVDGSANQVLSIDQLADNGDGTRTFSIQLARTISIGGVTTLTYRNNNGIEQTGTFISHPGNVNADETVAPNDILRLIDYMNGVLLAPWGLYSLDIDHSGQSSPQDILREIDLLNGAADFSTWLGTQKPVVAGTCP